MLRKINYSKLLAVLFLTVLIWVWADLAKTVQFSVFNVRITTVQSTSPNLWVSFSEGTSATVEQMLIKGPTSKIDKFKRKLRSEERLEFDFDAARENMAEPGNHSLNLRPFLNKKIREFGLEVESCKPIEVAVKVRWLVKKSMEIKCFDENQNPLTATVKPAQLDMFVPEDNQGPARVQLNTAEIKQARTSPVKKTPFIELPTGRIRAEGNVEITMPQTGSLPEQTITEPRLGYILSENMLGKYDIKVENLPDVISPIRIQATPEAKRAYENMPYQLILEIYDNDVNPTAAPRRQLKYNFPEDYVRTDEIKLHQPPVEARFKLIPLTPAGGLPSTGQ